MPKHIDDDPTKHKFFKTKWRAGDETINAWLPILDWDGENRAVLRELLSAIGKTDDQIDALSEFDLRMIPTVRRAALVREIGGIAHTATNSVTRFAPATATASMAPGKPRDKYVWIVNAIKLVNLHPAWSDRKIAKQVDKDPSQLSRCDEYQHAAAVAREDKSSIPRGHRTSEGSVEAYDEP